LVKRLNTGNATSSALLAGILQTNATLPSVTLTAGWNIVAWPREETGSLASLSGLAPSDTSSFDYLYCQNVTSNATLARLTTSGWKTGARVGGGVTYAPVLVPGAGLMIKARGAGATWAP